MFIDSHWLDGITSRQVKVEPSPSEAAAEWSVSGNGGPLRRDRISLSRVVDAFFTYGLANHKASTCPFLLLAKFLLPVVASTVVDLDLALGKHRDIFEGMTARSLDERRVFSSPTGPVTQQPIKKGYPPHTTERIPRWITRWLLSSRRR